ncbi:MAG: DUF2807 domain-containing protein [Bacteroidaceae bacterium]|nr:DUF2807 domain-containing protein [Bacteroidaceae bacterium]
MKKTLFMLTLGAVALLTVPTSCQRMAQSIAESAREEMRGENGKQPRYLRDSEEWGKVIQQELALEDFEKVRTTGLADVVFTQGEDFSVVAEGNEKVLPLYDFSVEEGTLVVATTKKDKLRNIPFIRLLVTAPTLTNIDIMGAGDVMMRQPVEFFNDLNIHISGAGDIEIDSLLCDAFSAEISGAGDIDVYRLKCLSADVRMSGVGDTDVKKISCQEDASFIVTGTGNLETKVRCNNLTVEVTGDGEASIKCESEHVTATVGGTGSIDIEGTTHDIVVNKSGLGNISTRQLRILQ